MREILFRGKRTYNDEWVKGCYHYPVLGDLHAIAQQERIYKIEPETLGQFTGLTDKNGMKIFEGDIIKGKAKETFIVVYENRIAGFMAYREHARITPCMNYGTMQCYEVIGNIYDNPSLMEDSQ